MTLGSDHSITAILEPENGIDLEYRFGQDRRVEQIKARSTGEHWNFAEFVGKVLPSLYRSVDIEIPTAYVFVTETTMGNWQEAYGFFKSLRRRPVPQPTEMLYALDDTVKLKVGRTSYTERGLFEHIVWKLAGGKVREEERLRVWHLLRDFHFLGNQDYSELVRKIHRALVNHGTSPGEVKRKRTDLIGDLFDRAAQGNGKLESTGFFKSHGLSESSLKRWVDIQARASRHMFSCLEAQRYRRDWDVRKVNAASSLFFEEPRPEEITQGAEPPLVSPRSAVLFTGDSGQGKSWHLYRLGYELAKEDQIAILVQGTGAVSSDLDSVATVFCREIWGTSSVQSLQDLVHLVRRELPELQEPWLTVLIDGVRDEEYALRLLQHPWERLGLRVVLGSRGSERFTSTDAHPIPVTNFTLGELSQYLQIRLGVGWIDFPEDVQTYLTLPLFASLFCDIQGGGATWKPVNEYHLFERAWSWQTAEAHLAASAVASLAARLPEEQIYPWPMARVWTTGLRDPEIKGLVDSGLLRPASGGRSLGIWHDRILNWAVAEGLVGALRCGEITAEALVSRSIYDQSDNPLHRRLGDVAMDTLWLLTTPEFGLNDAVSQFLTALIEVWDSQDIIANLSTLGDRIVPYLFSQLASLEEDEA